MRGKNYDCQISWQFDTKAESPLSKNIIYNKPTTCNSGSIVLINNYKYALHVSDALCVHHREHYKL